MTRIHFRVWCVSVRITRMSDLEAYGLRDLSQLDYLSFNSFPALVGE